MYEATLLSINITSYSHTHFTARCTLRWVHITAGCHPVWSFLPATTTVPVACTAPHCTVCCNDDRTTRTRGQPRHIRHRLPHSTIHRSNHTTTNRTQATTTTSNHPSTPHYRTQTTTHPLPLPLRTVRPQPTVIRPAATQQQYRPPHCQQCRDGDSNGGGGCRR